MRTLDHISMYADPDAIFRAAAEVENWPKILPHYRWVKVLGEREGGRVVEMAAKRGVIPVKWTAVQTLDARSRRVYYRHIGGPTRGMNVEWSVEPHGDSARVVIVHEFSLEVPLVRSAIGKMVVDTFFIKHIAGQTLGRMKDYLETGE